MLQTHPSNEETDNKIDYCCLITAEPIVFERLLPFQSRKCPGLDSIINTALQKLQKQKLDKGVRFLVDMFNAWFQLVYFPVK